VTNAALYGGYLRMLSGAATTSAMFTGLSIALGSNTGSNFLYSGGGLASGKSLDIESSNSGGLAIDSALNTGTGKLILRAAGKITESGSGKITATTLTGSSHGAVTLNAANVITKLGAFTTNNGAFALTDAHALTVTGTVNAGTKTIALTTTGGTSNNLAINATAETSGSAGVVTLVSAGKVGESTSTGAIVTHKLNVTAKTGISLTSTHNNITTLGINTTTSGTKDIHL
jgi:hypothetical protein